MVTIVKHEWHQHDRQYAVELDEALLAEIYPDSDEDEIAEMLQQIADGEMDVQDVIDEAYNNDVEIQWDFQYDDCWTDRKGGYEVTYELGDADSWHTEPEPTPPTHKCSKCRWTGNKYETGTIYHRADGTVIEDYFNTDEESDHETDVCPMCDSTTELTEQGVKEEQERAERQARWDAMDLEEDTENSLSDEELEAALGELKAEFDLMSASTIKCTECEWEGSPEDCEKEGICPNCCAYTELISDSDVQCVQCEWTGTVDEAVEGKDGELVCPECGEPIETKE